MYIHVCVCILVFFVCNLKKYIKKNSVMLSCVLISINNRKCAVATEFHPFVNSAQTHEHCFFFFMYTNALSVVNMLKPYSSGCTESAE